MPIRTPSAHEILRLLAGRSGWILRSALAAALLAAGISWLLPPEWEATATLLPPDRRSDDFRYPRTGTGLRRLLESFRLRDRTHPSEIYRAILSSDGVARRLVERFELRERWRTDTVEEAIEKLHDALEVEFVPFGPIAVHVRAEDDELAAALANAAVEMLPTQLDALFQQDVGQERSFLQESLRESLRESVARDRDLARFRTRHGLAASQEQASQTEALALELAARLAGARTALAESVRIRGRGSGAALDAEARVHELEQAIGALPAEAAWLAQEEALAADVEGAEAMAILLAELTAATYESESARAGGVEILDAAQPPESPSRRRHVIAALLALAGVPLTLVGQRFLLVGAAALAEQAPTTLAGASLRRLAEFGERVASGKSVPARARTPLVVITVAAVAVLFTRLPVLAAALVGVLFLLVLAADRLAAWLLLIIALPWAWDYVNERAGFVTQFPTEPGIILLTGAWVYSLVVRGGVRVPRSRLLLAITVFLGCIPLAMITTWNPRDSVFHLVSTTGLALGGAIIPMFEIRDLARIRAVLLVFLVNGVLASLVGIAQVATSPLSFDRAAFFIGEPFLYNHGPFAAYLGFPFAVAIVWLLHRRLTLGSLPLLAAGTVIAVAIFISLTRAEWVAAAALFAVIAAVQFRRSLRTLLVPLVLATIVLVPVFLSTTTAKSALQRYITVGMSADYESNVERMNRWVAAVRMLLDHPLTGVGPSAYETAYPHYREAAFATPSSDQPMGSHSEVLKIGAEQGIPGLLAFAFLVTAFFGTGIHLLRSGTTPEIRRTAGAICAAVFMYWIHMLFNEYWRFSKITFSFWIFIGLLGALAKIDKENRTPTPSPGEAVRGGTWASET